MVCVRWLSKMSPTSASQSVDRRRSSEVELTPLAVIIAVVIMCLILLGLYFYYQYLGTFQTVYDIIGHICIQHGQMKKVPFIFSQ